MTRLRALLTLLEDSREPMTLTQMARLLDVPDPLVEDMLGYWVRKGRVRMVATATGCAACGVRGKCPFIAEMPRGYELVTGETIPLDAPTLTCGCGDHCAGKH
jgi:hypothetical protein